MTGRSLLLACLVPLALGACAGDKNKAPIRHCPQVAVLRELERLEDYGRDAPQPDTLVAVALMRNVEGECEYRDDGVDISFTMKIVAEKGPRLGGDQASFPYFVSLIDPGDDVIGKELLTAKIEFPSGSKNASVEEPLHVFIPLKDDKEDASGYRVLMGFQLGEEQLKAAREKAAE